MFSNSQHQATRDAPRQQLVLRERSSVLAQLFLDLRWIWKSVSQPALGPGQWRQALNCALAIQLDQQILFPLGKLQTSIRTHRDGESVHPGICDHSQLDAATTKKDFIRYVQRERGTFRIALAYICTPKPVVAPTRNETKPIVRRE